MHSEGSKSNWETGTKLKRLPGLRAPADNTLDIGRTADLKCLLASSTRLWGCDCRQMTCSLESGWAYPKRTRQLCVTSSMVSAWIERSGRGERICCSPCHIFLIGQQLFQYILMAQFQLLALSIYRGWVDAKLYFISVRQEVSRKVLDTALEVFPHELSAAFFLFFIFCISHIWNFSLSRVLRICAKSHETG